MKTDAVLKLADKINRLKKAHDAAEARNDIGEAGRYGALHSAAQSERLKVAPTTRPAPHSISSGRRRYSTWMRGWGGGSRRESWPA